MKGTPSSEHWKVGDGVVEENSIVADVADVGSSGPDVIVVCGGDTIVHV